MPKDPSHSDWITVGEAARRIGVSTQTIRRAVRAERIACHETPGGHRRVWAADVDELAPPADPHATPAAS